MQTRKGSVIESLTNVVAGYALAISTQFVVFPLLGIHLSVTTNVVISLWFTVISIIRSYTLRRLFANLEGGS